MIWPPLTGTNVGQDQALMVSWRRRGDKGGGDREEPVCVRMCVNGWRRTKKIKCFEMSVMTEEASQSVLSGQAKPPVTHL